MTENIVWQDSYLTDEERFQIMGQRGTVLWLTGLSGSGKSTVATELERIFAEKGYKTFVLDGDNVRHGLNSNLGFSPEDRTENIRRIAEAAKLLASAGIIVIVCVISPEKAHRELARNIIGNELIFAEIYIKTPLEECIKRDPKGLYKKALDGEISNFTGVSAPYEEPDNPEIFIDTDRLSPENAAKKIEKYCLLTQKLDKVVVEMGRIAGRAGDMILEIYERDFAVEYKADKSPLTEADRTADAYINAELERLYPEISRLSEETADDPKRRENDLCFIIDPLDGTKEFVKKNGEFTVNIGLVFDGKPVAGAVFVPITNTLYFAAKGRGAFKVGYRKSEPIHVSCNTEKLVLTRSRSHLDERTQTFFERNADRISEIKISGSSVKGCMIAEGTADAYYRLGLTSEWDTCAMQAVVECAGGYFIQADGTPMRYNRENTLNDKGFIILNRKENLWTI